MLVEATARCLLFSNPLHLLGIVSHEVHVKVSWGSYTCGRRFRCECEGFFPAQFNSFHFSFGLARASHLPGS
jgi:hypothetical protein